MAVRRSISWLPAFDLLKWRSSKISALLTADVRVAGDGADAAAPAAN